MFWIWNVNLKTTLNTQIHAESKVVCLILGILFFSCSLVRCKEISEERDKKYGEKEDFEVLVNFNGMYLITKASTEQAKVTSLSILHLFLDP